MLEKGRKKNPLESSHSPTSNRTLFKKVKDCFPSINFFHQVIIFYSILNFRDVFHSTFLPYLLHEQISIFSLVYKDIYKNPNLVSSSTHSLSQSSLFIDYLCFPSPPISSIIMSNGKLYCIFIREFFSILRLYSRVVGLTNCKSEYC